MEPIKALVVKLLNQAVARYIRRNKIKVIAVAGSIGKTSTTNAIRTVLEQKYKVHHPKTAYNTNKSVHLEMFDLQFATSTAGWVRTVGQVLVRSLGKADYEVLVVEIGTDHPGELQTFAWLQPEIGVLTAIAPEHMEYFKTIEAVAKEELSITGFCKKLVFNANTVPRQYVTNDITDKTIWYGRGEERRTEGYRIDAGGGIVKADFKLHGSSLDGLELQVLGEHSLDALMAAATVADLAEVPLEQIASGLTAIQPVKGRMQRLKGVQNTIIIDDSYNASPEAVKAALDVLGQFEAPQRIAVLGAMNEMGEYSAQAHAEVGGYCDPAKLDMVITIGQDANDHLAPAASKRGCQVKTFASPYMAGEYVRQQLQPGSVLLFKGSQNGVFAEEAIKAVLADKADEYKLVRQSEFWMDIKSEQFK